MLPNPQMFAQDCSEEELRAICEGLFVFQGNHGIDAHGQPRRNVTSHERDGEKQNCDSGERRWIVGAHAEK
jgi:hypothetical protein